MEEKIVERFGEGWVGKGGFAQNGVREFAHHGQLQHGHDFAAFDAEDGGAEDLFGAGIDDDLEKTARFVDFEGSGDVAHRHPGDLKRAAAGAGFLLRETDAAKLGVDIHGVGNGPVLDAGAAALGGTAFRRQRAK